MLPKKKISCTGYGSGIAAGNPGCGDGPKVFFEHSKIHGIVLTPPVDEASKLSKITSLCTQLAQRVKNNIQQHEFFVVVGGDHSSAIGTWSGAASAVKTQGKLGLIWIDAHLDSHTFLTSETGNVHGMPVAVLLGHGEKALTNIEFSGAKILPENICIIGARSYEEGEKALLEKLRVRVFYIDEVKQRGFENVFAEALKIANHNTVGYGLSIDLDAIDPVQAPGTGTKVKEGIDAPELIQVIKKYCAQDEKLCGMEIAEFNPHLDEGNKTLEIMKNLINLLPEAPH